MQSNIFITKVTNLVTGNVFFLEADTAYARECAQEGVVAAYELISFEDFLVESVDDYEL